MSLFKMVMRTKQINIIITGLVVALVLVNLGMWQLVLTRDVSAYKATEEELDLDKPMTEYISRDEVEESMNKTNKILSFLASPAFARWVLIVLVASLVLLLYLFLMILIFLLSIRK